MLFAIDNLQTLYKLKLNKECELLSKDSLSQHSELSFALKTLTESDKFGRLCISDRSIALGGKTYCLETGQEWDLMYQGESSSIE